MGTFGALLAEKLGVTPSESFDEPEPAVAPVAPVVPAAAAAAPPAPAPEARSEGATMRDLVGRAPEPKQASRKRRVDPPGVVRRKR